MRRRNCNLELRLVTPSLADYNGKSVNNSMAILDAVVSDNEEEAGSKQKLTIFYNGRILTYDVTQCQARDIISLANQEMLGEKKINHSPTNNTSDDKSSSPTVTTSSPVLSPNTALCMNKSLQRFLEKRKKTRAQATSPY